MWFGLRNEIYFWFIRTFITRNGWMPEGPLVLSSSDEKDGADDD